MVPFRRLLPVAVLSCFAVPVAAQTAAPGACGQPVALTTRLAAPLPEGFPLLRLPLFLQRSEPAYVEFSLAVPQDMTLQTETTQGDPVLALYDSSGALLDWDDDGAGDYDSLIVATLGAGTYCAQVRPVGTAPVDSVAFNLVLQGGQVSMLAPQVAAAPRGGPFDCGGPGLVGSLADSVTPAAGPARRDGQTDSTTGESWYGLSIAAPTRLRLDASSPEIDTVLEVLAADGTSLHENDDYDGLGTDSRIEAAFAPGDYCVKVRGFAGAQGGYTLSAEPLGEADPTDAPTLGSDGDTYDAPCSDPELTMLLAQGLTATGSPVRLDTSIDPRIGAGWFALSVDDFVEVQLQATSPSLDTVLELYDLYGELLVENDDFEGMGTDSRIDTPLDPGDYCVLVRGFAGAEGDFTLALAVAGGAAVQLDLPDPKQADQIEDLGLLTDVLKSYAVTSDPVLFASFAVSEAGPVVIEGVSVSSAFRVVIYDADAEMMEATDITPAFTAATLTMDLPVGVHLIALVNEQATGAPILRQITVSRP